MKIRLKPCCNSTNPLHRTTFIIIGEGILARSVTPELAAWIVAANAALENHGWPYRECERVAVEFGPALTNEVEIEI